MGVFSVLFLQTSAALHLSRLSRKIWKHTFLKNASLLVCKIPFLHSLTVEWMDKNGGPFCSSCCCLFLVDLAFLATFVFDVTVYCIGNLYTGQWKCPGWMQTLRFYLATPWLSMGPSHSVNDHVIFFGLNSFKFIFLITSSFFWFCRKPCCRSFNLPDLYLWFYHVSLDHLI